LLGDGAEYDNGTDPLVEDTDGDGLPDGLEVHATETFPGADPLRRDIFLEVDYMREYRIPTSVKRTVRSRFANAPVENPDNTTGIDLHIVRSNQVPYQRILDDETYLQYMTEQFDHRREGYYYAVLIDKTSMPSDVAPNRNVFDGSGSPGEITVTGTAGTDRIGNVFMHELGHAIGLRPNDFEGIDGTGVGFDTYPSVMNYNAPSGFLGYSDGTNGPNDFDDWEFIENNMYEPGTSTLWNRLREKHDGEEQN
jgi:hypothetical protein